MRWLGRDVSFGVGSNRRVRRAVLSLAVPIALLGLSSTSAAQQVRVGGTIRNFQASHPDFNRSESAANFRSIMAETYLGADRKPVFWTSQTLTTVESASTFDQWWRDAPGVNLWTNHTILFQPTSSGSFRFEANPFWPIDNVLFGNQNDLHNEWFTYELHTFITLPSSSSFSVMTFTSSDDLLFYLNGILVRDSNGRPPLSGVHPLSSYTVVATPTMLSEHGMQASGYAYPLDVFYAHRSSQHEPALAIEMPQQPYMCLGPEAHAVAPEQLSLLGSAVAESDGSVRLVPASEDAAVGGIFLSKPVQVATELRTAFDFRMTGSPTSMAEGLAFVLAKNPASLGNGGPGLGYDGIPNSLAIEFDTHPDPANFDVLLKPVSIHTNLSQPNSAGHLSIVSAFDEVVRGRLDDGNWHHVLIDVLRDFGPSDSLISVTLDDRQAVSYALPNRLDLLEHIFDNNFVYAGIVSSNAPGVSQTVEIAHWAISTLTPDPLASQILVDPRPVNVGQSAERLVQTKETCGTPLVTGGLASRFQATLTLGDVSVPVTITDSADGSYGLSFTPTRSGTWSLSVSFDSVPLAGSPVAVTVIDDRPVVPPLPSITVEATSPSGASVSFTVPPASDDADGSIPLTCTPATSTVFALGTTTVSCIAVDSSGHLASGTFSVTVVDTTAPILPQPSDLQAEATGPGGAVVSWPAPNATDIVSGDVAVSCNPPAGSLFPQATTVVQCTATDGAGNTSLATFGVSIVDTTAPFIDPPSVGIIAEATGPQGAAVVFDVPSAIDIVDGAVPVTCSPPSGSTFPLGPTIVSCASSDAAGNTSTTSLSVTVRDSTPPVIIVPSDIVVDAADSGGATVSWSPLQALDTVAGVLPVDCAPAPGSLFPVGSSIVTCAATDGAGNTASAHFSVSVRAAKDQTPPAISGITLTPDHLWPPNGNFTLVNLTVDASDAVDPSPTCQVIGVGDNDPDGESSSVIVGPLAVELRAKKAKHQAVRTYELTVACNDAAGNRATRTASISVTK